MDFFTSVSEPQFKTPLSSAPIEILLVPLKLSFHLNSNPGSVTAQQHSIQTVLHSGRKVTTTPRLIRILHVPKKVVNNLLELTICKVLLPSLLVIPCLLALTFERFLQNFIFQKSNLVTTLFLIDRRTCFFSIPLTSIYFEVASS